MRSAIAISGLLGQQVRKLSSARGSSGGFLQELQFLVNFSDQGNWLDVSKIVFLVS